MSNRNADQVVAEIEKQVNCIDSEMASFPWEDRLAYAGFLAQTYFYVRRVSQVLASALARTPVDNAALHQHFVHALVEEKDHDALAVNDIRELGFQMEQFAEHPLTRAYYQTLFYMIDVYGPVAVMGYFFVLEAWAALRGRGVYDRVVSAHGPRPQTFIHEHVLLDAEHYPQAVQLLRTLDAKDAETVKEAVAQSGQIYRYMVMALRNEFDSARAA